MFEHSITIYNKFYDFETDLDIYQKTELYGVLWSNQEGYIRRHSRTVSGDKVVIYIPITHKASRKYINPVDWENLENKEDFYTINSTSLVVKDVNLADISSLRDLNNYFTITTVDFHDFGGDMRNWEVTAK